MHRLVPRYLIATLIALASLGLIGCGSDDSSSNGSGDPVAAGSENDFEPRNAAPDDAKSGGSLKVLSGGDVDSLDPGATYYSFGYMVHFATQRSLLGWPADVSDEPVPDLADGEPEITDDGRTLTFKIREGIKYSPPVDRDVVAADFKYAIERGLMPGVANGYMSSYLNSLEGFEDAVAAVEDKPGEAPEISGITAPDPQTLTLKFEKPIALTAMQVLSLPLGSPVPARTL